jgi:hypothetical protein
MAFQINISLPATLEGAKNRNSAITRRTPKFPPPPKKKFKSTMGKLFEKQILRKTPNPHWGKKRTTFPSVRLSSISQYDTSMYDAGGSRHPKFQQFYVDGCSVLGYRESLRHNSALWATIYIVTCSCSATNNLCVLDLLHRFIGSHSTHETIMSYHK